MKNNLLRTLLIGSLATFFITANLGVSMHKVKATENLQEDRIEDDEVLVKGGSNTSYVLNKNYSIFTKELFTDVTRTRVGEQVKIWDIENNLKDDLNKLRQQKIKYYEGYHLMTNEERDDMVKAAKQQNISLKQYLMNCGIDLRNAPIHMTSACGGPNRIWHYSNTFYIDLGDLIVISRHLYFEKFDISNNHYDNTLIGDIFCQTEDLDRFLIPFKHSKSWRFVFQMNDHFNEFNNLDYLMLYVKNTI